MKDLNHTYDLSIEKIIENTNTVYFLKHKFSTARIEGHLNCCSEDLNSSMQNDAYFCL